MAGVHVLAGKKAPQALLVDIKSLLEHYYSRSPDPALPDQMVSFGTSGHRGSSFNATFTETHIAAITQAVCDFRRQKGIGGPLFMGMDTHALSGPAHATALEVLAANGVETFIHEDDLPTPTPVISFSILEYNRTHPGELSDGIVITPSHNPPDDGGFKYNPPHGGPADSDVTDWIQSRANELIRSGLAGVKRFAPEKAMRSEFVKKHDYVTPYIKALPRVLNMDAIRGAGLKLCADALGGSSAPFWEPLAAVYNLNLTAINTAADPTFSFMTLDRDGKVRMDCSSPWAMASLIEHSGSYDLSFGNDPDADRHGIVTPSGLMNPNHYLAVSVDYLFRNRSGWKPSCMAGKTLVSSALLDRVAAAVGRKVYEVPVGFKWFVEPLINGSCAFGGEESAGASFLRLDGTPWSTDKDGIIMDLLAVEMTAVTGNTPDKLYSALTDRHGESFYRRIDAPADSAQRAALKSLSPDAVKADTLAGDAITAIYTRAPGNDAPIGGLKVSTDRGWFAARPSGTEDIYKIYAESFVSEKHLEELLKEAQSLVNGCFDAR